MGNYAIFKGRIDSNFPPASGLTLGAMVLNQDDGALYTLYTGISGSTSYIQINGSGGTGTSTSVFNSLSANTITLTTTPVNNDSNTQILTRNATTGVIEYRSASTLGSGSGSTLYVSGFTYNDNNKLTISQTGGLSDLNVFINTFSALTVTNYIDFNTGTTVPQSNSGRVFYNNQAQSLAYYPDANQNVIVNVGQQLFTRVNNVSGNLIPRGSAVKIQTASSGLPNVALAISTDIGNNQVVGLTADDIPNGSVGLVLNQGLLSGITISYPIGSILYLSDTTPGGLVDSTSSLRFSSRTNQVGYVIATGTTTGQIYVSINNENNTLTLTNLERNILEGNVISTGTYEFTGITQSTGQTINIAPTRGWVVNNTYSYATSPDVINVYYTGGTNITLNYLSTSDQTFILVNSASTLVQQTTFPTPQERRENIFLGKVVHPSRSSILSINQTVDYDVSPMSSLRDLWVPLKLINQGVLVSANGTNLSINTSSGTLWGNGINWVSNQLNPNGVSISSQSPVTFQYRTRFGPITGGTAPYTGNTTFIDPANYDLNGVVTPVGGGSNESTNQRIYLFPTGLVRIQYGQKLYTNLAAAVAGSQTETFVEYPLNRDSGILIGILSVNKNATLLNDTTQAVFNLVSKFGEILGGTGGLSTTTLQQAYDNSSNPEIVTNIAQDGVQFRGGTGNDNDKNIIIENNAGIPTAWITASGDSYFNTVSATTYYGDGSKLTGIVSTDNYVTGGTYSNGSLTLNRQNGSVIVTGFTDYYVTGGTFSNNTLTLNRQNGSISITGFSVVNNTVTVGLTGSTSVGYNSIKSAVESIANATSANTYTVKVAGGVYYENPFTIPSWVSVVGDSSISTVIQANDSSQSLIKLSDQSALFDVQVQGCTDTGVSAIIYSSSTTPQSSAIAYVENVRFGSNYTHAKVVASGGANIIMQCSNVKYGGYPFTVGFYATNDGSGIGRMQLRNVTSTNGGIVTTPGLIFAKADAPSCGFIVNGCLLTKAAGAAAGTGFYVENGGFLRLTAVNFQRWAVGIDAPQIGSAPSIDAIALNFENNTIDVNIAHSGATGKIQGTDSFLKTIINQNAPLYEVNQDPKEITVAKKGGDFTSIKSAVDYLISSGNTSQSNRYIISVGPGVFYEDEIDLTSTPYVSIVGSNIQTTQILPNSNTQHIIKIGVNNEVSFLNLSGASSGYAGIYCYDIGDFGQAHKVSFYDCDTNVWVESNTQDTKFYGEYLDYNGQYTYGTKVIGNNGYLALANMENYYNFPTGSNITYCNYATGSGATLSVFVGDNVSNGVSGTTAFYVQDGAELNASTVTSDGNTYGIRNPNIGDPVRFDVDNASFINGEWDLYVERVGTFGTFGGSSNHEKVFTNSTDVYWAFLDINDGEFDITRKASVTFTDGSHTDFTTLVFEGGSMGVINGGTLSTISGFTVQVGSGFGYLEKSDNSGIVRRIDWSNSQINLSANTDNYIYFNENSNLSNSGSRPNTSYNILLGRVVTDTNGVEFIDLSPFNAEHTSNRFGNLFSQALGPIYATGSIVTEGTTPLTLNVTAGEYYYSTNEILPTGGTGITFTQYYRTGTGSTWVTSATTLVNNTQFDNNGTLTALTSSYYTKHTLYLVGDASYEKYFLVLGQNQYATLVESENALLPTPPTYFSDAVVQIANIYVQQGFSGITQIEDIRPTIAFRAGGVNASSVHGNLLGLSADDHTQYLLVSGTRAMGGNLDMGSNDITNVGTVDGVTVSAHASRHQFGGFDPVGSVTPSPNAIPYADVSGTLDSWVSTASTTTLGRVTLSTTPVSASNPIAVGNNDLRLLKAVTGGTFSTNTLTLTTNDGSSVNITGFSSTDYYVTGGTYSNGILTLNRQNGSVTVSGFLSADTFVTGVTYSSNTLTVSRNNGQPNLTATIGLNIKSGTVTAGSFAGNPRKYTVTFTAPYPNTSYSIGITGSDNRTFIYESKTVNGFTINTNSNTSLTGNVDWQTIATGES